MNAKQRFLSFFFYIVIVATWLPADEVLPSDYVAQSIATDSVARAKVSNSAEIKLFSPRIMLALYLKSFYSHFT